MISVDDALVALFDLVTPLDTESVPLRSAAGRVLRSPVKAQRDQPPFDASAMDGYAVQGSDAVPGAILTVIGEAAAGAAFGGTVGAGQAVRIFTGAPVPAGANRIVIQEDVARDGNRIVLRSNLDAALHIRPAGGDFRAGDRLDGPRLLGPVDLARIAAMNSASVTVTRRPEVAIIATGDELVMPGETPRPDQIVASNGIALAALAESAGARPRLLPIARDTDWALHAAFGQAAGADLIVTIGGASVGDHDLVGRIAAERGIEQSFYKVAMRPGKPLMAGRMGASMMIGLPGNPVSSIVCGHVFVVPVLRAMLGLPARPAHRHSAPLAGDLDANGPREHYMRARLSSDGITAFDRQDSSLLTVLADADALLVRPAGDGPRRRGELVNYLPL